jgi:nucleoside phosphorylase
LSDITFNDPCILFPLPREASGFLREFRPNQRFPGAPCRARFCGPAWLSVLVVESGFGAAATEAALDWLLSSPKIEGVAYRPPVVISAGFAGALEDRWQVGDIILATDVADTDANVWETTWPGELPAGEWRPAIHRGRLLTVSGLVGDPDRKRELGRQHLAIAVDMESAVVARVCHRREVPFACVRVIVDGTGVPVSREAAELVWEGRGGMLGVLLGAMRFPGRVPELWQLARQTSRAAEQLGTALGELLTLTLPGGREL